MSGCASRSTWDDSRKLDRGKVMTAADLDAGKLFGRYLDVDGDGITYRTLPGTHPTKGAFFTRGTSKDRMARYSEEGPDYQENMERLLKKHRTAATLVPPAVLTAGRRTDTAGRDLLRFHQPGDDRGGRNPDPRTRRVAGPAAGARLSRSGRGGGVHRRARPGLRGRAEPRRPVAIAADQRAGDRSEEAGARSCTTTARRSRARFIAGAIGEKIDSGKIVPLRKVVS